MKITGTYRNKSRSIILAEASECNLTEGQMREVSKRGYTHVFETDYSFELPKYLDKAMSAAGWSYGVIGYTTYVKTVWGAKQA